MGSVSLKIGDGTARFRRSTVFSSSLHLLMLLSVLTTNLFALYAFTYKPPNPHRPSNLPLISHHISSILHQINVSSHKLHQIQRDLSLPSLPGELDLFLSPHPLPLGPDSRSKLPHMVSSVAHSCSRSPSLLSQFMSYKPHSLCPSADSHLPSKLLSLGCDPLPRRRCLSSPPPNPPPLLNPMRVKHDFTIDHVLDLGPRADIRIGFDIAGGAGDFAAEMRGRNVTIVTSSLDGGSLAANKGVFPLQMSTASRFPFYDSVFDLVHTVDGLDEGGVDGMGDGIEFLMFDIDRVLRVGGLFWLDNYVCVDDARKRRVTKVIERFGYKKLKWVVGEKADSKKRARVYLSAVLRKPARG